MPTTKSVVSAPLIFFFLLLCWLCVAQAAVGQIPEHLAGVKPGMLIDEVKYLSKSPVKLETSSNSKDLECSFETWTMKHPEFERFTLYVHRGYVYLVVARERTVLSNPQVGQLARDVVSRYGKPEYLICGFANISSLDQCPAGRFFMALHYRKGEENSLDERGFDVSIWGDDYEAEMRFRGDKTKGEVPKGIVFQLWKGSGYYESLSKRCAN